MPGGLYLINDRGFQVAAERRLLVRDDVSLNLSPEVSFEIPLGADDIEYHFGWRTWTAAFGFAALAANAQKLQFQNPNASNTIMELEEITVSSSVNDQIIIGQAGTQNNANLTTPIVVHAIMDGRMRSSAGGAIAGGMASISTQQSASIGGSNGLNGRAYQFLAGTSFTVPQKRPYIFLPGTTMIMGFQAVNAIQFITLEWRERILNDQENAT